MPTPPVVGITLRPQHAGGLPPRVAQNRAYIDAVLAAGAVPLGIAPIADTDALRVLYDRCDALLLPGGPDVEPHRYGEEPIPECNVASAPELDAVDFQLIDWALDDDLPILAICRGFQVLNVALGGTLWQDVAVQGAGAGDHDAAERTALIHDVDIAQGSALAGIVGATRTRWNSIHHQGIRRLAAGLVATATTPDGLVEGYEMPGRPILGVQCHPEELAATTPWAADVIRWLVEQVDQERSASASSMPRWKVG
jgi:putative glutamine amidotransferase